MPKFLQTIVSIALMAFIGVCIYQYVHPKEVERVVVKEVPVKLTPTMLDSLRLGFYAEFKATLRPKIIDKTDTATIRRQLNEIFALKDSLRGLAALVLSYETDSLGKYRDTLRVSADFVSERISVVFRPTERNFALTVRDTIPVPKPRRFGAH